MSEEGLSGKQQKVIQIIYDDKRVFVSARQYGAAILHADTETSQIVHEWCVVMDVHAKTLRGAFNSM